MRGSSECLWIDRPLKSQASNENPRSRDLPVESPSPTQASATPTANVYQERRRGCCGPPSGNVQLIPIPLEPWLGQLNVPRNLTRTFSPECARNRQETQTIEYFLPPWFVHIDALIHVERLAVRFSIQTPRVVHSLRSLYYISLDDFKRQLSTHALTLDDIDAGGYSVLHVCPYIR